MRIDGKDRYDGVLSIPEGTVNDYKISHIVKAKGEPVPLGNIRTAFFRGQPARSIKYRYETTWHELSYDGGVWMTDLPIEQWQHDRELRYMKKGRVLIGGLGIGYAATVLASRPGITEVVVIERSPEVIQLVAPHVAHPKLTVIQADLFDYLRDLQHRRATVGETRTYDHAFYDIWQSDGESTFHNMVVPLLHLSHGIVRLRPTCWNEQVMRGQLHMGLDRASRVIGLPEEEQKAFGVDLAVLTEKHEGHVWSEWQRPFWEWVKERKPEGEFLKAGVNLYASGYGNVNFPRMWNRVLGRRGDYFKPTLTASKNEAA